MPPTWQDVRCARIAAADLAALADLRREEGIRVILDRDRAWVCWEDSVDREATVRILAARLLPLPDVEIYARRDGRWYRPGEHLPAFEVPFVVDDDGIPLDRLILPEPIRIAPAGEERPRPVPIRVVRDDRGIARPASAMRCWLRDLSAWADLAPTARIEALSGAWCSPVAIDPGDTEAIVIGPAHRLPTLADGLRWWGDSVLIPMGFRADPDLAEPSLRDVIGAGPSDLVLLDETGVERIPRDAFRPLGRASIRLAMAGGGLP